ncbi:hypothetical protein EV421DRAFT_1916393 [Armillaria borealis]|uniref:RING-type domain-containing protein n=1 Tax=Armillaria borealis TaxID=47425 RepID=A0AA39M5T1_9AGAR|nr:hypothetical protein EV421DRAFT_1916393 [Armillaria borealis]
MERGLSRPSFPGSLELLRITNKQHKEINRYLDMIDAGFRPDVPLVVDDVGQTSDSTNVAPDAPDDYECPCCTLLMWIPMSPGCGHNFCPKCIIRHILKARTDNGGALLTVCPMCQRQIRSPPGINLFAKEVIRAWVKANGVVPEMSHDVKLNGSEAVKVLAMFFEAEAEDSQ